MPRSANVARSLLALAIARAVYFGANVLILDEPTAALGVKEAAHVLRIIVQARAKGVAVILVTHNVRHAMRVGDHFAVLIGGQQADDFRGRPGSGAGPAGVRVLRARHLGTTPDAVTT